MSYPGYYSRTGEHIQDISVLIDEANARRDPEAQLWNRVAKVAEEAGEVAELEEAPDGLVRELSVSSGRIVEKLIKALGGNPRKPGSGDFDPLDLELMDVALTALAALEHRYGNDGLTMGRFNEHVASRLTRLREASA